EPPQVGHAVLEQRHPLDAEAPRVAGVLLGVDATVAEDVGMDHAAAADLDPAVPAAGAAAGPAADGAGAVELVARLGVAEVVGPHPDPAVGTEERLAHVGQRALEVAHGEALVDGQPLELHEDGAVAGVGGVPPVDAAGDAHVNRRPAVALAGADLHGG